MEGLRVLSFVGELRSHKACAWVSDSLWPHGLLLCWWDFPGKNTGTGCQSLLQGIFLPQGIEPGSPALQADSLLSEPPGKPPPCGEAKLKNKKCTGNSLANPLIRILHFSWPGPGFNPWWVSKATWCSQRWKSYPLFDPVESGTDTICLHVRSSTVLSMSICTYTNQQRYKAERHKIRIVTIILFYNLHIFSLSIKR